MWMLQYQSSFSPGLLHVSLADEDVLESPRPFFPVTRTTLLEFRPLKEYIV